MGFDLEDLDKIIKTLALVEVGIQELKGLVKNKQEQEGKTPQEIFEHAEQANKEARTLIDSL